MPVVCPRGRGGMLRLQIDRCIIYILDFGMNKIPFSKSNFLFDFGIIEPVHFTF